MGHSARQLRSLQTRHITLARYDSAVIRINVAPVDAVRAMLADDDPCDFLKRIRSLTTRDLYPAAARALEFVILPATENFGRHRRLIKTLNDAPQADDIKLFRIAIDLGIIRTKPEIVQARFTFEDIFQATAKPRTARAAWIAIHLLGHVRFSADETIPISDCTGDVVGTFPKSKIERAGLALHLLVKMFRGERFGALNLARAP
jgi:hypothetical protein